MPLAKAFVDMLVPVHPTGYLEDTGCPMSNCADCVEARWANATGQSKYTTFLAAVERYDANTREHEAAAVRFGEALVKLGEGSITSIDPKLISGHFGLARELLAVQEGNAQEVMRLISKASSPAVTLINLGRAPPNTAVTSVRISTVQCRCHSTVRCLSAALEQPRRRDRGKTLTSPSPSPRNFPLLLLTIASLPPPSPLAPGAPPVAGCRPPAGPHPIAGAEGHNGDAGSLR